MRRYPSLLARLLACVFVTFLARSALAQASFDVQHFRASPHSDAFITVESGAVAPSLDVRAQVFFNYSFRPLDIFDQNGTPASSLDHRFDMAISGAISLFDRLSLALSIPATLYQGGNFPTGAPPKNVAFGDLRLDPKVSLLDARRHFVDLALMLSLTVPTATGSSFAGDRSVTFGGELDVSRRFGPARAAINFGFVVRQPSTYFDIRISHELYARTGVGFDVGWFVKKVPLEFFVELFGRTSAVTPFVNAGESPLEGILGARFSILRQLSLTAGVGRGLLPGYGAPAVRAFVGVTVIPLSRAPDAPQPISQPVSQPVSLPASQPAPQPVSQPVSLPVLPQDPDKDGLFDSADACPFEAEDFDGFIDDDGCPELDNDSDGIKDSDDKCPLEPEIINGVDDFDGCPDKGKSLVVVTKEAIQILEKVMFQSGKATILPQSFGLLDQVVNTMKNHGEIGVVRIEGHTDSDGPDAFNLQLSQMRAEAVRGYLIKAGIAEQRLQAKGFGEAKPIAPNSSRRGKDANRRVEFNVVQDAASAASSIEAAPAVDEAPAAEPIKK